jgi:RHS repeat-associated protein
MKITPPLQRVGSVATRRLVASTLAVALMLLAVTAVAPPASAAGDGAPVPSNVKPVHGAKAAPLSKRATPKSSISASSPKVEVLKSGSFKGPLPAAANDTASGIGKITGSWTKVGGSSVEIATAEPSSSTTIRRSAPPVVSNVSAKVLTLTQAKAYGLKGLVVELARNDGGASNAPLAVRIPNSLVGAHYGADYAARLRWTAVTPAGSAPPPNVKAPELQGKKLKHAVVTDVPSEQDTASNSTVLVPQISSAKILLTPAGTPTAADGTGNFAATPLATAASWQVSAQTGDFSWSYDMRTPPAAAGPSPNLALKYDSQSVDGESGSTNNQPSAIGDGWSQAGAGFIERSYVPCAQDNGASGPVTTSGDQCWKTDNATISFDGHSGQLVKDSTTGQWRLQDDDSRIEHLVGTSAGCAANGTHDTDCWRVTTTDGTQYYFGLNQLPGWTSGQQTTQSTWTEPVYGNDPGEPCHASSFAASSCTQAWRWNLDYVVDTHGNAEAYYYDAETNRYAQNGGAATPYVRGGQLDHIDYGFSDGNAYATNAASDRATFTYAADGRCSDATLANCTSEPLTSAATSPASPADYPDVPFDQLCSSSCPTSQFPTFWTDGMLQTVTTYVLKSGSYAKVDSWKLDHSFPAPGDGTSPALWLTQVTHTGYSGASSIGEPPTVFNGVTMQNRVWAIDGLAPLDKYRIASINDSSGSITSINYSQPECTPAMVPPIEANPQSNTYRCYPEWWTPSMTPPQPSREDLFHKYVVTSTVSDPETGGGNDQAQEVDYVYGTPAWRYDNSPLTPDADRTWDQFAGYNTVEVRTGDHTHPDQQAVTDYTFFQGLDGDRATTSGGTKTVYVTGSATVKDSLWFAGQVREQKTLMGVGGSVASDTTNDMWASSPPNADDGTNTARFTGVATATTTAPLSTGGNRTTSTVTTFANSTGLPTTVESDASDVSPKCTTTSYTPANSAAWIVGLPSEVAIVATDCGHLSSAIYPDDAISDTKTTYDGLSWNLAPTKGDVTETHVVDNYTGTTAASAHWTTQNQAQFDSMGRATHSTDVLGHTSAISYTPAAGVVGGGATTSETTTNTAPFGWHSTTTYDPAWGAQTSYSDENGDTTTATYDALGRRTAVWDPDNPQASAPTEPSTAYSYTLSTTSPNAIDTKTQTPSTVVESYALFDGLDRPIQTQAPAEGGGMDVTDNWYDGQGRVWTTNGNYWVNGVAPSASLFVPADESDISSETVNRFDAVGRSTKQTLISFGVERHETDTAYLGVDRVDMTPPSGGTPTSTYTNSANETTSLIQYLAASPSPTAAQETSAYSYNPSGQMTGMTDPAGNHWSWAFDVLGHQTDANDPDTGDTTQTYDDAGNVLTSTDARGDTLAYSYDALNRKIGEYKDSSGTSGTLLASWSYDTAKKGQLASSSSYSGSAPGTPGIQYKETVNSYDAADNPTSTTVSIPAGAPAFGGTSYTTTQAYYTTGDLASTTYPAEGGLASERVRTTYDGLGKVNELVGTNTYDNVSYTSIGQVSQHQRISTDDLYSDYTYDLATGQLDGIQQISKIGSTVTHPQNAIFTNDEDGNVKSIVTTSDSAATDTQCFSYDYLQNLTSAWTPSSNDCTTAKSASALGGPAPYWTDYSVDPQTGNRTSTTEHPTTGTATTDTYSYPAAVAARPHAVQTVTHTGGTTGTSSYGYAADGGTTTRPGQTLTYDAEGRVSTVTAGSTTQSDIYDASGNLLLQTDSTTGSTLFLGATQLHETKGSTTASAVRTYSINGTPVAERSTTVGASGSVLTWLGTDAQGTVNLQVSASAGIATVRYQDPFGQARGTSPTTWSDGHGFLNATTDPLSGLVQLGARMFDASIGRFLSVDPVLSPTDPQQNNGYSYSHNSPINLADPTGLTPNSTACSDFGGGCGYAHSPSSGGGQNAQDSPPSAAGNNPIAQGFLDTGKTGKRVLHAAGFNLGRDGVLRSDANAPQLGLNYQDGDDNVMDAIIPGAYHHKYIFGYGGKSYVVWVWKGEYGLWGDGAEIGFYEQDSPVADPGGTWYSEPNDPNLPKMAESLSDNGSRVASFAPANPQVWVASFHPGVMDMNGDDLHLKATVTFPNAGMYGAFMESRGVKISKAWSPGSTTNTAIIGQ